MIQTLNNASILLRHHLFESLVTTAEGGGNLLDIEDVSDFHSAQ